MQSNQHKKLLIIRIKWRIRNNNAAFNRRLSAAMRGPVLLDRVFDRLARCTSPRLTSTSASMRRPRNLQDAGAYNFNGKRKNAREKKS